MEHIHFADLFPRDSRSREITELLSYVIAGESCQLIGLPGAGREDVSELLAHNRDVRDYHLGQRQASYHFVLVNMAEAKGKDFSDVLKLLFFALATSLRDRQLSRQYEEVNSYLEKSMHFSDPIALMQGIKDAINFLANRDGIAVVFFLNRFEEYVLDLAEELFILFDSLSVLSGGKFSAVFSLHRPLEQMVDPKTFSSIAPTLGGQSVFLSIYDGPSLSVRKNSLEEQMEKHFQEAMFIDLIELTGGHKKLVKRGIEEVLRENRLFTTRQDLMKFLLDSKSIRSVLYEIWGFLLPKEQAFLKKQVTSLGYRVAGGEEEKEIVSFFKEIGILINNFYTITLFEDFVRYRVEHKLDEAISYREETEDIFRGEQSITETLTSSEYRLLKLLLQSPGRTVEREDVIMAVWSEQKNTEGVSDQAVDQLVYRLRNKIEANPSEPRHLQTVKGRGFIYYH